MPSPESVEYVLSELEALQRLQDARSEALTAYSAKGPAAEAERKGRHDKIDLEYLEQYRMVGELYRKALQISNEEYIQRRQVEMEALSECESVLFDRWEALVRSPQMAELAATGTFEAPGPPPVRPTFAGIPLAGDGQDGGNEGSTTPKSVVDIAGAPPGPLVNYGGPLEPDIDLSEGPTGKQLFAPGWPQDFIGSRARTPRPGNQER